jgi:hypothetical protein
MSLHRLSLRGDYREQLAAMFPRVTVAQLLRFDELAATDRLVTDDGAEHPALIEWVAGVTGARV